MSTTDPALRAAVRDYLATLPEHETAPRCEVVTGCGRAATGAITLAFSRVSPGGTRYVCAEHAADYAPVAPLPPRAVALRALAALAREHPAPASPPVYRRPSRSLLTPRRLSVRAADDALAFAAICKGAQTRRAIGKACGRNISWAQRVLARLIADGRVVRDGFALTVRP